MTFFLRMLKSLKLLAISPVATVLWFGALGGMVWRLEPDELGRSDMGSIVGRWIHGDPPWTSYFRGPTSKVALGIVGPDGRWHIRTFANFIFGIEERNYLPPLNDFDQQYSKRAGWISMDVDGSRGLFATTKRVWLISGGERPINAPETLESLSIEALNAMSEDDQLKELVALLRPHVESLDRERGEYLRVEFTTPLWSGYIYNGVMVVLLLVGLHSMRWVYRGVPLRQLRQVWRPDEDCTQCGYSLAGLSAEKCPECGTVCASPGASLTSGSLSNQ